MGYVDIANLITTFVEDECNRDRSEHQWIAKSTIRKKKIAYLLCDSKISTSTASTTTYIHSYNMPPHITQRLISTRRFEWLLHSDRQSKTIDSNVWCYRLRNSFVELIEWNIFPNDGLCCYDAVWEWVFFVPSEEKISEGRARAPVYEMKRQRKLAMTRRTHICIKLFWFWRSALSISNSYKTLMGKRTDEQHFCVNVATWDW